MAIETIDEALASMRPPEDFLKVGVTMEAAGVFYSPFYVTGRPGAAAAPSPGLNGAALTTYAGQIPFTNPAIGNSYLARLEASASVAGKLLVCDRLWHNSGYTVTTTTAQNTTHPGIPARDQNGATNGDNVMLGIEVSTATTNGAAITNMTASYTDQSGNAGATATIASFPQSATVGTFVPFQLAAGDTGVRSVQSLTLGTSLVTGVVHLVQYRILAAISCPVANVGAAVDAITGGFVRLYDNTVPFLLWLPTATTAVTLSGQIILAQG